MKTCPNKRFFGVTITENWIESNVGYFEGADHKSIAARLLLKNKRVTNERFREIETTGSYYRITEQGKGGKAMNNIHKTKERR